jgi:hypothetical protein
VKLLRTLAASAAALAICGTAASAQQTGAAAMQKLSFLSGKWTCTIKNGPSNGEIQLVKYVFSPDGHWMTETSWSDPGKKDYATQVWGYDANAGRLVAYQFARDGLYTKTVQGWMDGAFTAKRNDNGATVSVKQVGASAIEWTIASVDGSFVVKEECVRR